MRKTLFFGEDNITEKDTHIQATIELIITTVTGLTVVNIYYHSKTLV